MLPAVIGAAAEPVRERWGLRPAAEGQAAAGLGAAQASLAAPSPHT